MIDSIDVSLEKENDYQALNLKVFLLHGVIICVTIGNTMNDDLT